VTSRERVLVALAHREGDRVPVDYSSNPEVDDALEAYFGVATRDEVLEKLHVDMRVVVPEYIGPSLDTGDANLQKDIWGVTRRRVEHETGAYFDVCEWPLKDATTRAEIESYPSPSPDWFDYESCREQAVRYDDYAISGGMCDFINGAGFLRGMENVFMDMATENPVGLAVFEKMNEFYYEFNRRHFEVLDGRLDILYLGDDLGTQRGSMISVPMWRKLLRPLLKRQVDLAKEFGAKVMFHSCGSVREFIPDLIDLGIDCLDTVQPEVARMDPVELKREYGDRISYHGTISTGGVIAFGTPDDVRREVKERLRVMGPGGGFVLAPTHQLQSNTPVENIVAMYETAHECGAYPINC